MEAKGINIIWVIYTPGPDIWMSSTVVRISIHRKQIYWVLLFVFKPIKRDFARLNLNSNAGLQFFHAL